MPGRSRVDAGVRSDSPLDHDDLLALLVAHVADYAIFLLDVDGNVLTWNAGARALKGYEPEEIVGRHFSVFYPPEDVAVGKPGRELEIAAAEGRLEDEGWRVRKEGTRFWANVVITALRDSDGVLRGYGKITQHIGGANHDSRVQIDLAADDRDRTADDRDRSAEAQDAASEARDARSAARDLRADARERAADLVDVGAAADRAGALRDRRGGADDRSQAAEDREAASADRVLAARDRATSSIDELTRAHTRDAGMHELRREVARAKRTAHPFVLAFVDVDGLKGTNDSLGHAAGDRLLRRTADTIRAHFRPYDLLVRMGGDEFLGGLPDLTIAEAARRFAKVNAELGAAENASATVGLAEIEADDSLEDLMIRADAAMYKERSRTRPTGD